MDEFLKIVSHDLVRFEEGLRMLLLVIGRPSSAITFPGFQILTETFIHSSKQTRWSSWLGKQVLEKQHSTV